MNDPMATPVGRLPQAGPPPPAYNTKKDAPLVDQSMVSYDQILQAHQQQQSPQGPQAPQAPGAYDQGYEQAVYDPNPPMQQYMPTAYEPQYAEPAPYEGRHYPKHPTNARKDAGLVSQYKDVILIAAAVFVLLFWVQPKLRTSLPQLFGSNGGLNVAGMVSVGVVAGLLYRFGAAYAPV